MRRAGCLGLLFALAALLGVFLLVQGWGGRGSTTKPVEVAIPQGATLGDAATDLQAAGAIPSARRFVFLTRLFGTHAPIKAGAYRIPAHLSQSDILHMLQGGRTLQKLVTIPEGLPSILVEQRLMATKGLTGAVAIPAEGSVLPDSYAYGIGEPRAKVLKEMQGAMTRYLAAAWAKRAPGLVVATPRQALILASIVEKETAKPDERAMVAGVYSNRLRTGMPLQADPTIIYPITKGLPLGRRILESEVHAKNAYNTYAMTGLPAGPICNPGRLSIDAVLHPARTQALYFVADGSGGHAFADTLEQQNANVAKWYAIRRARGEM